MPDGATPWSPRFGSPMWSPIIEPFTTRHRRHERLFFSRQQFDVDRSVALHNLQGCCVIHDAQLGRRGEVCLRDAHTCCREGLREGSKITNGLSGINPTIRNLPRDHARQPVLRVAAAIVARVEYESTKISCATETFA